jgi:NADH-quinone oxidoreductase subunit A
MTWLVFYMLLFTAVGIGFIFVHLIVGKLIRPSKPHSEKLTIYECGEPTIGSAWIQFDLRFYVIALLFVIFDVEVAFFFPWAVVFGHATTIAKDHPVDSVRVQQARNELLGGAEITPASQRAAQQLAWLAFWDIIIFFGTLLVGFAYLWKRGDLAWVRSLAAERPSPEAPQQAAAAKKEVALAGVDADW